MNIWNIFLAIFIACGFVGWPIVGNYSRACGAWVGTMVIVSTAVAVAFMSFRQLGSVPVPDAKALILLCIAGAINGIAFCLYSDKMATMNASTATVFVATVSILMVVIAPILNWLLNNKTPDLNQTIGFCLAVVAIYFLSK